MNTLTFLLALAALASAKTFHGDQVLTLHPVDWEQVKLIQNWENIPDPVDFWNPKYARAVTPNSPVDIRVPSRHLQALKKIMENNGIEYTVKIEDVQFNINQQMKGRNQKRALFGYDYTIYHTYDEINQWTKDIASDHSNIVTRSVLGQTYENRDIPMLEIGTSTGNPAIFIDCGFHAREWISPAFCQYYVNYLITNYGTDSDVTSTINGLTFYIVPVFNGDGYKYSWETDRMWRKTRSDNNPSRCIGVDPNRNFDAAWDTGNDSPCQQDYRGPSMESEIEVQALANFIKSKTGVIKTYLTFHAYGQYILYPYSYKFAKAADSETLDKYAVDAKNQVAILYGTQYTYGQGARVLYTAPGGSDDFSYDYGVPLSYTIELRDTGSYGFLLPENQIQDTCDETIYLMKVFTDAAMATP